VAVSGTYAPECLHQVIASSLAFCTDIYRTRSGGELQFEGERPGPGWHSHGYFAVLRWMLVQGEVERIRLWKHRWFHPGEKRSCHSRPPDELAGAGVCTLILVLLLWAWLDGERGLLTCEPVLPELSACASPRTVQRWSRRLVPDAMAIQQAIRLALIHRSEPRPVEQLFPSGLPPPAGLKKRLRRGPSADFVRLWRAIALLLGGATKLDVQVAVLLAEARGRSDTARRNLQ
jgi:hypothetical protein